MVNFIEESSRIYLSGNTYPIRDRLRGIGAHWDGDRKMWWVGKAKRADAEALASSAPQATESSGERRSESLSKDTPVRGKAQYKGKAYLVIWSGTTKRGQAFKLAFRDGSKSFWADAAEVTVIKTYQEGRRGFPTIGSLERFREEMRSGKRDDLGHRDGQRYECKECGDWVTAGEGSCWETGAAH